MSSMDPGAIIDSRYRLLIRAGRGGFATVFRASDLERHIDVAIKILDGSQSDYSRFEQEALLLRNVVHPHVVRYVGHGFTETGSPYLAMEWLDGMDLGQALDQGPLDTEPALRICLGAAAGLGAAHSIGIVHRDVKPTNLFLVGFQESATRLIDFGIARPHADATALTATGQILGTPSYMSPEQAAGARHLTPASDVFSLGTVLFECLTGRTLFVGMNGPAILAKILSGAPLELAQHRDKIPPHVETLLMRMLAFDGSDRFQNGEAVALAIGSVLRDPSSARELEGAPVSRRARAATSALHVRSDREIGVPSSVRELIRARGGELSEAAGEYVSAIFARASTAEAVERTARLALEIAGSHPSLSIEIVTSRASSAEDRSHPIDGTVSQPGVVIDSTTAGYLGNAFDIAPQGDRLMLTGLRSISRPLLPELVGRAQELATIDGAFCATVEEESARAVILLGEAGAGKSRLLDAAAGRIARSASAPTVLSAQGDVPTKSSPFAFVAQLVAHRLSLGGPLDPRAARALLVDLGMNEIDADWTVDLAGLSVQSSDIWTTQLRSARDDAQIVADAYRSAWLALVEVTAEERPLVLVLDDIHLADPISVQLLDAALELGDELCLLVLAAIRTSEGDSVLRVLDGRDPIRLELRPLRDKLARDLVRSILPDDTEDLVDEIVDQAGGNPLRLEQLARLGKSNAGSATIRGSIEARLARLDPNVARALRAASVFGRRFPVEGVASLLGMTDRLGSVEVALRQAEREGFVDVDHHSHTFIFHHALIRDASYESLPDEERERAHARVADWYAQKIGSDSSLIAWHYGEGSQTSAARRWYQLAAHASMEGRDLERAEDLATRALGYDPSSEDRADLLLLRAEVAFQSGKGTLGAETAAQAMQSARPGGSIWVRAAGSLITSLGQQGREAELRALAEEVRSREPDPEAQADWIIALCRAATQLLAGSQRALGRDLLATVETRAPSALLARAWIARVSATAAAPDLDYELIANYMREASALFRAGGDIRSACLMRIFVASIQGFAGSFEAGEHELQQAESLARRAGASYFLRWADYTRGKTLAHSGDPIVARAHLSRVRTELVGNPRMIGGAHLYSSLAAFRAGDAQWAEAEARAALAAHVAPAIQAPGHAALARALVMQGDFEGAKTALAKAALLHRDLGTLEEHETLMFLVPIELAIAVKSPDAKTLAEEAVRRLFEIARRLSTTDAREGYLHGIEIHDSTLRLALELGVDVAAELTKLS